MLKHWLSQTRHWLNLISIWRQKLLLLSKMILGLTDFQNATSLSYTTSGALLQQEEALKAATMFHCGTSLLFFFAVSLLPSTGVGSHFQRTQHRLKTVLQSSPSRNSVEGYFFFSSFPPPHPTLTAPFCLLNKRNSDILWAVIHRLLGIHPSTKHHNTHSTHTQTHTRYAGVNELTQRFEDVCIEFVSVGLVTLGTVLRPLPLLLVAGLASVAPPPVVALRNVHANVHSVVTWPRQQHKRRDRKVRWVTKRAFGNSSTIRVTTEDATRYRSHPRLYQKVLGSEIKIIKIITSYIR